MIILNNFFNLIGGGTVILFGAEALRMILNYYPYSLINIWTILGIIIGPLVYFLLKGDLENINNL